MRRKHRQRAGCGIRQCRLCCLTWKGESSTWEPRTACPCRGRVRATMWPPRSPRARLLRREQRHRPLFTVAQALAVRLRGTKGGFWIAPTTTETQWVAGQRARAEDDHIVWRWTVVPRRRGRSRLTVMMTVNTAGRDGVVATTSPPDRVIDVSVGPNQRSRVARVAGWILAGLVGAALAHLGPQYWQLAIASSRRRSASRRV